MSVEFESHLFAHEKLRAWQEARVLIEMVYRMTRALPKSETFGLASQMNRAAVSVACNLAEGAARISAKDQAHFSQLSYSSLMEVACLLTVIVDLSYAAASEIEPRRQQVQALSSQINRLRQTQGSRS